MSTGDEGNGTFLRDAGFGVQLVSIEEVVVSDPPAVEGGRLTSPTGLRSSALKGVESLADLLARVASDVGRSVAAIEPQHRPRHVEAEIEVGLSATLGPVLLAVGSASTTLRAKLVWEIDPDAGGP